MRLNKWLSQLGLSSRREAERWIASGRLAINGTTVVAPGAKLDPDHDTVHLDGSALAAPKPPRVYWLLNKPDGYLTSRSNEGNMQTIYDLPQLSRVSFHVPSVGRLDFRSEGLLILSNDGDLVHRLMHPKYQLARTYHALSNRPLTEMALKKIQSEIYLDGTRIRAKVSRIGAQRLGASRGHWYRVTLWEGRNRVVRRLFEAVGHPVLRLVRVQFGCVHLPEDLKPGHYVQLPSNQINALKKLVGL